MSAKTIQLKDFANEIRGFSSASLKRKRQAVVGGLARSIPMLVERSPVDTAQYAQSWGFTETETSGIIGNSAPHAGAIEHGTRPHTPPIGPLLAWAKRVLQDPSQPPNYSPDVKRLALAVQAKIKARGQEPKHIMENAIPEIIENIRKEFLGIKDDGKR